MPHPSPVEVEETLDCREPKRGAEVHGAVREVAQDEHGRLEENQKDEEQRKGGARVNGGKSINLIIKFQF